MWATSVEICCGAGASAVGVLVLVARLSSCEARSGGRVGRRTEDFSEELEGAEVVITMHNGVELRCGIARAGKYWLKVVAENVLTIYINKAHVVHIKPLHT